MGSPAGSSSRQQQPPVPGALGRTGPMLQSALKDHTNAGSEKPPSPEKPSIDASPNSLFRSGFCKHWDNFRWGPEGSLDPQVTAHGVRQSLLCEPCSISHYMGPEECRYSQNSENPLNLPVQEL